MAEVQSNPTPEKTNGDATPAPAEKVLTPQEKGSIKAQEKVAFEVEYENLSDSEGLTVLKAKAAVKREVETIRAKLEHPEFVELSKRLTAALKG